MMFLVIELFLFTLGFCTTTSDTCETTLEEWLIENFSVKYLSCFENEGFKQVKDLARLLDSHGEIHDLPLIMLKDACEMTLIEFLDLKKALKLYGNSVKQSYSPKSVIREPISNIEVKISDSQSITNGRMPQVDVTFKNDMSFFPFFPLSLHTYNDILYDTFENAVSKIELKAIINPQALPVFNKLDVEIISYDNESHRFPFNNKDFNIENNIITFSSYGLNKTIHGLSSNIYVGDLLSALLCKDIAKILKQCKYQSKVIFIFKNNNNQIINNIKPVSKYNIIAHPQLIHHTYINFYILGFAQIDTTLMVNEKQTNTILKAQCHTHLLDKNYTDIEYMNYKEMLAISREKELVETILNNQELQYPLCAGSSTLDDEEYAHKLVISGWPEKTEDFTDLVKGEFDYCYVPCVRSFRKSYLFEKSIFD